MGTKRSHRDSRAPADRRGDSRAPTGRRGDSRAPTSRRGTGRRGAGIPIRILAGGRWRGADPAQALYGEYVGRLRWPVELVEIDPRIADPAARMAREGVRMLDAAAIPAGRILIALDERGRALDSPAFAEFLRRWQDDGVPALVFAIGGADGLAPPVRAAADLVLSFGAMTWPHLMVRAMLAEQLYRASAILSGHPYHRG